MARGIVPEDIAAYAAAHSAGRDAVQQRLVERTREATGAASVMQIGGDQGVFMEVLTRSISAKTAIEIGTFTGYSSLAIARGLGPDGRLICCDVSAEWTSIAREHWKLAGVEQRIDLRIAPALETLASLDPATRFDLAFIDADKAGYAAYIETLYPILRPGAIVLIDNTLWGGGVLDTSRDDPDTVALRDLNDALVRDDRFTVAMLTIGDGVTMLEKR